MRSSPGAAQSRDATVDLFDAPVEWVIAQGRLFLCAMSLVALYLDPLQLAYLDLAVSILLGSYLVYALGVVLAIHGRLPDPRSQIGIHAADVLATSLLLFLTEGPSSSFFAFFTFILLAATLRWNWRGTVATAAILLGVLVLTAIVHATPAATAGTGKYVIRTIVQAAYLAVIGGMLAYVGAFRERSRERLANLAKWPAYASPKSHAPALASTLAHAGRILAAPRVLAIWEESEEPFIKVACLKDGKYEETIEPAGRFGDLLTPRLATTAFASDNASGNLALLRTGHMWVDSAILNVDLIRKYGIVGVASAPFGGSICRGRVFILDRTDWNEAHVMLADIIASRLAIELDRQALQIQAEDAVILRERNQLARDLHDGVLQSLTAAGLQLKLASARVDEETLARLNTVKQLLTTEQRRIREFVQSMRPSTPPLEDIALDKGLRRSLTETASNWNCGLSFSVTPDQLKVPRSLTAQLSLMLAEAIANAARHGEASQVEIAINKAEDCLMIQVTDNGRGFQAAREGADSSRRYASTDPASLRHRVDDLGGSLQVLNSASGAELRIRLPLP